MPVDEAGGSPGQPEPLQDSGSAGLTHYFPHQLTIHCLNLFGALKSAMVTSLCFSTLKSTAPVGTGHYILSRNRTELCNIHYSSETVGVTSSCHADTVNSSTGKGDRSLLSRRVAFMQTFTALSMTGF